MAQPKTSEGTAPAAVGSLAKWTLVAVVVVLSIALLGGPAVAFPRWRLGRWHAKGSFLVDWESQDDRRSQNKYETLVFQERVSLRNVGAYVVDPRLLTLDLGGSFGLSQEKGLSVQDTPLRVGDGILYDYDLDAFLLADRPYPITVFANRNQRTLAQGFGGRSDVVFESRGGIFELREDSFLEDHGIRHFSSMLDVHQELRDEDSLVFGSPFRRDETRNIVRYRAHKGGERSDFDLRYEFNDVNDKVNPFNVFDSHTLRALHSIDFGPIFNRRLDSVLYHYSRTGSGAGNFTSLDEALHFDHWADLSTDYRYNFSRSDSDVGVTTTNSGSATLRHLLYDHLTTTADVHGTYQDLPNGEKSIYGGRAGFDYRRSLPWDGFLFADLHGGYQVDDNNFTSSRIDVVDERHLAPPVLGGGAGFALDNTFVLEETVVIFDVEGGSRLPTELNLDYILDTQGNITRVIPLAGSPVIRPGDALEVSYSFAVDPSVQFSTTTLHAGIGVEFPWFGLSYEHYLSDQHRLSGEATEDFLIDQNSDRVALDVHHDWGTVQAQARVAYEVLSSTLVDSRTWRFSQVLAYQPRADVNARITGDQYWTEFPSEDRNTESYLVRANIDWVSAAGFSVSPFAGYSAYRDTGTQNEEIIDAGIRMHWTYRSIEISPSFTWSDYRRRLNDVRAMLQITRRFF